MLGIHSLVSEDASDLEDLRKACDHEALEPQLGRDAEEDVEAEGIVMGHERPRVSASCDVLEHGRLDLHESPFEKEIPGRAPEHRAFLHHCLNILVGENIQISLAKLYLLVLKTAPLLGKRKE